MTSDPAYLRAFKNFAKRPPTLEESEAMEKEFYGESDRACGVLHASWVEQVLETAIRRRLRPNLSNRMFDFEGPVGTFSAKIMMGYALGLFGSKTNHDLLLIRTIRNEFAHCQLPLRFDLPEVKAVCDQLILLCHKFHLWLRGRRRRQHGHRGRVFAIARASARRIVAIELGTCRCGRIGGASGSVITGKGIFFDWSGGTWS